MLENILYVLEGGETVENKMHDKGVTTPYNLHIAAGKERQVKIYKITRRTWRFVKINVPVLYKRTNKREKVVNLKSRFKTH